MIRSILNWDSQNFIEAKKTVADKLRDNAGKWIELDFDKLNLNTKEWEGLIDYIAQKSPKLKALRLRKIKNTIPKNISKLKHLEELDLRGQFSDLPNIGSLKKLKTLTLKGKLSGELTQISGLEQLEELNLYGNTFTKIPAAITNTLPHLKKLRIMHNPLLKVVDARIFRIPHVNISQNAITEITGECPSISKEHEISLFNNKLKKIPPALILGIKDIGNAAGNPFNHETLLRLYYQVYNKGRVKAYTEYKDRAKDFQKFIKAYFSSYFNQNTTPFNEIYKKLEGIGIGFGVSRYAITIFNDFLNNLSKKEKTSTLNQYLSDGIIDIMSALKKGTKKQCTSLLTETYFQTKVKSTSKQVGSGHYRKMLSLLLAREALRERWLNEFGHRYDSSMREQLSHAVADIAYWDGAAAACVRLFGGKTPKGLAHPNFRYPKGIYALAKEINKKELKHLIFTTDRRGDFVLSSSGNLVRDPEKERENTKAYYHDRPPSEVTQVLLKFVDSIKCLDLELDKERLYRYCQQGKDHNAYPAYEREEIAIRWSQAGSNKFTSDVRNIDFDPVSSGIINILELIKKEVMSSITTFGHDPEDFYNKNYEDWQKLVKHKVEELYNSREIQAVVPRESNTTKEKKTSDPSSYPKKRKINQVKR